MERQKHLIGAAVLEYLLFSVPITFYCVMFHSS